MRNFEEIGDEATLNTANSSSDSQFANADSNQFNIT